MAKCATAGCVYNAEADKTHCIQHRPVRVIPPTPEADLAFVPMSQIPSSSRFNEQAGNLVIALKKIPDGQAIKVKLPPFKKITLTTAQRYALADGLRIGVRVVGEHGYLWKLSAEEIKAVEVKGDRLRYARSKRKGKAERTAEKINARRQTA